MLFDIIGFGFSVVTLTISHDLLGLTSRLADNLSANVIGLPLGTVFQYLTARRFVFAAPSAVATPARTHPGGGGTAEGLPNRDDPGVGVG